MPRYFWLLSVVFTVTAAVLLLDHFRTYSSRATILVIHKNEKTAASSDEVIHTIAQLPKTLSFYDRLLKQFPEINDPWKDMDSEEREVLWRERVFSERVDESGLIRLWINADTASDAVLLTEKSVTNLFQSIGRYYDIRTEIDIRTVDAPVAHVEISKPFGWLSSSAFLGMIVSALVSFGISAASSGSKHFRMRTFTIFKQTKKTSDLIPVTFDTVSKKETPSLYKEFVSPAPIQTNIVAEVPVESRVSEPNLPFLEEGMSLEDHLFGVQSPSTDALEDAEDNALISQVVSDVSAAKDEALKPVLGEPTAEELKRRLNQLLKGDMQ